MNDLAITDLQPSEAITVGRLLEADDPEYRQYFLAFDADAKHIAAMLEQARHDRYWGIWESGRLVGIVMLRGLDEGYSVPSFGVYVAQADAGRGIGKRALEFATSWCRGHGFDEMMLSVHPSHAAAVHLYEQSGFRFTGALSTRGHHVYRKRLS